MTTASSEVAEAAPIVPLWRFYLYFLRLGTLGFGGPIALAGFMQRDLVDERRWISRQDYLDGLALAQLAPGRSRRNSACISVTWWRRSCRRGRSAPPSRGQRAETARRSPVQSIRNDGSTKTSDTIAGAAYVLATRALTDLPTVLIALTTLAVLSRWKISELWLIGAAGTLGLLIHR